MYTNHKMPNDPEPDYGKAEIDYLKEALLRWHTERFEFMTQLIKMTLMLKTPR